MPQFSLARLASTNPRFSRSGRKVWINQYLPLIEEYQFREYLSKLDTHKSMGHDGSHPQVLREMTDIIVRILLIIFMWYF